jgi:hypothetical protein
MARTFYPTVDLECGACGSRFEAPVDAFDEDGFRCPSCNQTDPEQSEQLMKGLVALGDALEGAKFGTFAFIGAYVTNKPRIARVEQPETDESSSAQTTRAQIRGLISAGRHAEAFVTACNARDSLPEARRLVATPRCPRCGKPPGNPSPTSMIAEYARFWRGHCPSCDVPLRVS